MKFTLGLVLGCLLMLAASQWDKRSLDNTVAERLNEYVPSALESKEEYCERVYPLWEKTRDLLSQEK